MKTVVDHVNRYSHVRIVEDKFIITLRQLPVLTEIKTIPMMHGYVDVVQSCRCILCLRLSLPPSISVSLCVFPDPSLTPENLSTVLDSMADWLWELV